MSPSPSMISPPRTTKARRMATQATKSAAFRMIFLLLFVAICSAPHSGRASTAIRPGAAGVFAGGTYSGGSQQIPAVWSPLKLPTIRYWWRADLGVTTATGVSSWVSQVGGVSAAQATGSKQPTVNAADAAYGGQSTLSFALASSQELRFTASPTTPQPVTVYLVGQSGASGAQYFFGNGTSINMGYAGHYFVDAGTTLFGTNNSASPQAFCGVFNGASSALYVNNSQTANASGQSGATNLTGTTGIGSAVGGVFLNGKIAEIIIDAASDSAATRATVFAYFAARYRLSVN